MAACVPFFSTSRQRNTRGDHLDHAIVDMAADGRHARKAMVPGDEITCDYGSDYFDLFIAR
jgi:hypothetical protein